MPDIVDKYLTTPDVLALLRLMQGGKLIEEFAPEVGISRQYLSRLYDGSRNPGPQILSKLGLRRVWLYESIPPGEEGQSELSEEKESLNG